MGSCDTSQSDIGPTISVVGDRRVAHSQTTPTRHPAPNNNERVRASRSTLPSNLLFQKSELVAGVVVSLHP